MSIKKTNLKQKPKNSWQKPSIKSFGNAKKIVKNINVVGGGDINFSVLLPS